MKKLRLIFAVAAISLLACFNVFAGEWKQNDAGWWYDMEIPRLLKMVGIGSMENVIILLLMDIA